MSRVNLRRKAVSVRVACRPGRVYPPATVSPLTSYVIETIVTLVAIVLLAVLLLYGARRVGIGRPTGPLDLVGRLPLDGRRAVYLVRVGKRVFVIGASEGGLDKLGELDDDAIELTDAPPPIAFSDALAKVLNKKKPSGDAKETDAA